jgi:hypothetical protein
MQQQGYDPNIAAGACEERRSGKASEVIIVTVEVHADAPLAIATHSSLPHTTAAGGTVPAGGVPVAGVGYGPAAVHAQQARADAQMASAAAHAGDYGTAIKKEVESIGERIGERGPPGRAVRADLRMGVGGGDGRRVEPPGSARQTDHRLAPHLPHTPAPTHTHARARAGQAVSSGSAHPGGLANVPGAVGGGGGIGGAPSAQAVGAQAALPVPAAGTATQTTTQRITEYGAGGAPLGRGY